MKIKKIVVLSLNVIIMILIIGSIHFEEIPGRMFVAATAGGYNQVLNQERGVNVFVMEEKIWFLDRRGYLKPAKIIITVW